MLEIDEKAMAYCLVEALFAAGVINLPTYQNFLRMKREQEEEPPAKALVEDSARAFLFIRKSKKMEVKTCE